MKITRIDPVTKKTNTIDLNITPKQLKNWEQGISVVKAFPHLTIDEREFIKTGITAETWNQMFANHY